MFSGEFETYKFAPKQSIKTEVEKVKEKGYGDKDIDL